MVQLGQVQPRSVQYGRQEDDSEPDYERDHRAVVVRFRSGIPTFLPAEKVGCQ